MTPDPRQAQTTCDCGHDEGRHLHLATSNRCVECGCPGYHSAPEPGQAQTTGDGCPVCGHVIDGEHKTPSMAHGPCTFTDGGARCTFGPMHSAGYHHLDDGRNVPAPEPGQAQTTGDTHHPGCPGDHPASERPRPAPSPAADGVAQQAELMARVHPNHWQWVSNVLSTISTPSPGADTPPEPPAETQQEDESPSCPRMGQACIGVCPDCDHAARGWGFPPAETQHDDDRRGCCFACDRNACEWCPGAAPPVSEVVHRWFDQVVNTCGPGYVQQVHAEHEQVCAALAARPPADTLDWQPGRWWRVTAPDGSLWAETSDEDEARAALRPGDTLERMYVLERREWRPALDGAE